MARYKWTNDGCSPIGPRDGAELRSPVADEPARAFRTHDAAPDDLAIEEGDEGRDGEHHVHVHLPAAWMPAQPAPQSQPSHRPTYDAPRYRHRDQDPEPGQLVCRVAQNGETGQWGGTDCDGRPLVVSRGEDGALEIRHASNGNGEEDPDTVRLSAPTGTSVGTGAPGANDAGRARAFEQRMSKTLSPSSGRDHGVGGLRGYAELLRQHYQARS